MCRSSDGDQAASASTAAASFLSTAGGGFEVEHHQAGRVKHVGCNQGRCVEMHSAVLSQCLISST